MSLSSQTPERAPSIDLDDLRRAFPRLGFALYALDPAGAVTFEVYDGDAVYTFSGPSAAAAMSIAFPPAPQEIQAPSPIEDDPPNVFD